MEAQIQKKSEELDLYTDVKSDLLSYDFLTKYDEPTIWEDIWFTMHEPCTENMRMIVVISLMVYELEQNKISSEMVGELDYYYDKVFEQKSFENVFDDLDAKEKCIADLKWCYDTAKQKGLL